MEAKKVSVIIPFYNGVDWLSAAVQSVLDQTYKYFEIIVVNDGSPENVDDFLARYGEKIIYILKENGGPASARNMAMQYATGDYIAYLDSDDVWMQTKTEKQIAFMEECGAMWSHTGFFNWYPLTNKLIVKYNGHDYGNVYLQSFISLKANTPAIIIKRNCFVQHPEFIFFEDMRYAQDSALWSKIAYFYPLGLLSEPLVKIRQRGTNADLISLIRFSSKSMIYNKIIQGHYKDVPQIIIFIYSLYNKGFSVLKYMKDKMKIGGDCVEFVGKLFWVLPYVLERIILLGIVKNKTIDKRYYR